MKQHQPNLFLRLISAIGIFLFIPCASVIKNTFTMQKDIFSILIIEKWGTTFTAQSGISIYQVGFFVTALALLCILPLLFSWHGHTAGRKLLKLISIASGSVMIILLLVMGVGYNNFFMFFRYIDLLRRLCLFFTICMVIHSISSALFCISDCRRYRQTDTTKMALLIITAIFFIISFLGMSFVLLLAIPVHDYYMLPAYIVLLRTPYLLLFISSLRRG